MATRPSPVAGVVALTVVGVGALLGGPLVAVAVGAVLAVAGLVVGRSSRARDVQVLAFAALGTGVAVVVAGVVLGVLTDRADRPVRIGPGSGFEPSTTSTTAGPPGP